VTELGQQIPIITHYEKDLAPIYWWSNFSQDPEQEFITFLTIECSGRQRRTAFPITPGHHLGLYFEKAERNNQNLEAAILIGCLLLRCSQLPSVFPMIGMNSKWRYFARKAFELMPCETIGLDIPKETGIVIEGEILHHVRKQRVLMGTGWETISL